MEIQNLTRKKEREKKEEKKKEEKKMLMNFRLWEPILG